MFCFTSWDVVQSLQGHGGDVYARRCTFLNAGMSLCRNVLPFWFLEETNQQHFLTPPKKGPSIPQQKKCRMDKESFPVRRADCCTERENQDITDEDLCFLTKNSARNQQKVQLLRTFKMFNMSLSSSLLSSNVQERYEYGRNVCFQLTKFWSLKLYFCWFIFVVLMVPKVNKMYSKYLSGKVSVATLQYRALEKRSHNVTEFWPIDCISTMKVKCIGL